ncbi:LPXTG cell wall anchor domain-containing protein [Micromonospora sp. NBC_00362]|uniref:LPXTG cell wall anchor domain-containing protein n=1 Tax=Micromonospora sp. NBC_00362 TaxID=2975975 RepID=UPI00224E4697|nr:LPXTG cell wall anchor domain-containing protein [Micromonospora sp. NBC_00362]MCX5120052.1 LPXTG cell wall anchor domain-containing protein [Micromonospora sp. NBC_00362]
MARTAANYLVGGALAATASLALAVSPVLAADPASARGFGAVRAEPSADTGVTFEILPASPTPPPTQPPPTSTPTAPPQPTPSHGELPVTGSGGSVLLLAVLGAALLAAGWFAARRSRPS